MTDNDLITDEVVSTAKRLEKLESADALTHGDEEPLDVELTVNLDGTVKEVTLILTVGGPRIEVECYSGVVRGYWGGSKHSAPIFKNEELLKDVGEYYVELFSDMY